MVRAETNDLWAKGRQYPRPMTRSVETERIDLEPQERLELLASPSRWPSQMRELIEIFESEISAVFPQIATRDARVAAARMVIRLTDEYGGSHPYIPKGDAIRRVMRNLEIWASHDGSVDGENGIHALSKRHGVTEVHVWSILREQRALHCAERDARANHVTTETKTHAESDETSHA